MRINDRLRLGPLAENLLVKAKRETSSSEATGRADKVSLSSELREMQSHQSERLQAIKQAIAEGRYEVDLDRLASAIVEKGLL